MEAFFGRVPGFSNFTLFGSLHLLTILILVGGIYMVYRKQDSIRQWKYHDRFMRYAFASLMFINMTVYYGSEIIKGTWDIRTDLPLHFCFISGYLFMFTLVTNNQKLFRYVYFFSYAGPLPAILLPDLICGIDRFIFWQFFISHHVFLFASMYCLYVLKWQIQAKDALGALVLANIIFLSVFGFNTIFGTNYIMTESLPDHILRLMPFLRHINQPFLLLEGCGILAWAIAYLPVWQLHRTYEETYSLSKDAKELT